MSFKYFTIDRGIYRWLASSAKPKGSVSSYIQVNRTSKQIQPFSFVRQDTKYNVAFIKPLFGVPLSLCPSVCSSPRLLSVLPSDVYQMPLTSAALHSLSSSHCVQHASAEQNKQLCMFYVITVHFVAQNNPICESCIKSNRIYIKNIGLTCFVQVKNGDGDWITIIFSITM